MSRFSSFFLLLFFLLGIIFSSCKKNENTNPDGESIIQGNIELKVRAMHHSWGVSYINIYYKKNATTFPGYDTTLYDRRLEADGDGWVTFDHLYPGTYYLYAKGYDYFFGAPVLGYAPITLDASTVTNNKATDTLMTSE